MTTTATEQSRASVTTPSILYIGVDIGKAAHYVAFISANLLRMHKSYDKCPTRFLPNSRAAFEELFALVTNYAPFERCHVLLENTGHYGSGLIQFLEEKGAKLYRIHPKKRYRGIIKTDKADAQALAVLLYNQEALHVPVMDKTLRAWPILPSNETVTQLRGLVQHRHKLSRELASRKNELTAIIDELFPEFAVIYKKDQNSESALCLREKFPTARDVANASLDALCNTRPVRSTFPGREKLAVLQELARTSIGLSDEPKNEHRRASLLIKQRFLIREKRQLERDLDELDALIEPIVSESREGKILMSFAGIAPKNAATLIAGIGNIMNYQNADHLRSYMGWSPKQSQSGQDDHTSLAKSGNQLLKWTMYMVVMTAVRREPWRSIYKTLCKRMAVYNPKTGRWKGRMKAIGHIAGRMIGLIYVLLRRDYDLICSTPKGAKLPEPEVYDVAKHMKVRRGGRTH